MWKAVGINVIKNDQSLVKKTKDVLRLLSRHYVELLKVLTALLILRFNEAKSYSYCIISDLRNLNLIQIGTKC